MADPFVAEIRIFPFNFAPTGWALCNGQIMPISQNTALFSLLGTVYGGDGKTTFALPNLQGRAALHPGQGQGLSLYDHGQQGGEEFVTLLETEIPAHSHTIEGTQANGTNSNPTSKTWGKVLRGRPPAYTAGAQPSQPVAMGYSTTVTGQSLPHNNMMPYLTLNFCIALQGVFPPRQ